MCPGSVLEADSGSARKTTTDLKPWFAPSLTRLQTPDTVKEVCVRVRTARQLWLVTLRGRRTWLQ